MIIRLHNNYIWLRNIHYLDMHGMRTIEETMFLQTGTNFKLHNTLLTNSAQKCLNLVIVVSYQFPVLVDVLL